MVSLGACLGCGRPRAKAPDASTTGGKENDVAPDAQLEATVAAESAGPAPPAAASLMTQTPAPSAAAAIVPPSAADLATTSPVAVPAAPQPTVAAPSSRESAAAPPPADARSGPSAAPSQSVEADSTAERGDAAASQRSPDGVAGAVGGEAAASGGAEQVDAPLPAQPASATAAGGRPAAPLSASPGASPRESQPGPGEPAVPPSQPAVPPPLAPEPQVSGQADSVVDDGRGNESEAAAKSDARVGTAADAAGQAQASAPSGSAADTASAAQPELNPSDDPAGVGARGSSGAVLARQGSSSRDSLLMWRDAPMASMPCEGEGAADVANGSLSVLQRLRSRLSSSRVLEWQDRQDDLVLGGAAAPDAAAAAAKIAGLWPEGSPWELDVTEGPDNGSKDAVSQGLDFAGEAPRGAPGDDTIHVTEGGPPPPPGAVDDGAHGALLSAPDAAPRFPPDAQGKVVMLSDLRGDFAQFLEDSAVGPHRPITLLSASASSRANANPMDSEHDSVSLVSPLDVHAREAPLEYTGAPVPDDEGTRLAHICSLNLLDTSPEERYDRITSLCASIFKVPFVLVSLVDANRQWFKSVVGLPGVTETTRAESFCAWTLLPRLPEVLVVMDALEDARFRNNTLVTGAPFIRFYAGAPLVASNGARLGSLCIIDRQPRWFSAEDCNLLCNFAELTLREIEAERALTRRNFENAPERAADDLRSLRAWDTGTLCVRREDDGQLSVLYCNPRACDILGKDAEELVGANFWSLYALRQPTLDLAALFDEQEDFAFTVRGFNNDGRKIWIDVGAHSGTLSQLDNDMPFVAVPVDLESEDGAKACYWFLTVSLADTVTSAAAEGVPPHGVAAPGVPAAGAARAVNRLLLCGSSRHSGDYDRVVAGHDVLSFGERARSSTSERSRESSELPDGVKLRHVVSRCIHGCIRRARAGASAAIVQVVCLEAFVRDASEIPALKEVVREQCERGAALPASACLLPSAESAVLPPPLEPPEAPDDGCCDGETVVIARQSDDKLAGSLRSCIHDNMFKLEATPQELHEGVTKLDQRRAQALVLQLATGLDALHSQSIFHGEVTDTMVLVLEGGPHGIRPVLFYPGLCGVLPPTLEQVASVREDYILFFAPERCPPAVDDRLGGATAAADIWSVGVIMTVLALPSLPMIQLTAQEVMASAREGRLATEVLDLDGIQAADAYVRVALDCLSADPAKRPTARHIAATMAALLDAA